MSLNRIKIAALATLALIALSACSVNPATGRQSFTGFMSVAREQQVGRAEHPKILKRFGGAYEDSNVTAYVDFIGQNLAKVSDMPNQRFTFTVLNSPVVNAFAVPGGFIYVTRGLMALADNEAELAGVIAHEVGHVAARHTAQRYSQSVAIGLGAAVIGVLSGAPGIGDVANLGAELYLKSFSREQEFESDLLGVRYLTRAGYDTKAMASFLRKLGSESDLDAKLRGAKPGAKGGEDRRDIFATHPRTIDRVTRATNEAGTQPLANPRIGRLDYLERMHGLLYGDDPREGLIAGREFLHPTLKFRFRVPQKYRLINTPEQVIAKGPEGAFILFDMAAKPFKGRMTTYLREVWGRKLKLSGLSPIDVNGMQGATATGRTRGPKGARDIRLVALRGGPRIIYRLRFLSPPRLTRSLEPGFNQTTYSLKRMTDRQARAVKPLRIRVLAAKPGDTARTLAGRMAFDDFQEERFRVLNGLTGREPAPGQLVKIVTRQK